MATKKKNKKKKKTSKTNKATKHARDPVASAPPAERRQICFLTQAAFRELSAQVGYFRAWNSSRDEVDPLPGLPAALLREAISFWLDQFRSPHEQERSDAEWTARRKVMRSAIRPPRARH